MQTVITTLKNKNLISDLNFSGIDHKIIGILEIATDKIDAKFKLNKLLIKSENRFKIFIRRVIMAL